MALHQITSFQLIFTEIAVHLALMHTPDSPLKSVIFIDLHTLYHNIIA